MNLVEEWNRIDTKDDDLSVLIDQGIPTAGAKDPLEKIKRNLTVNSFLGTLISLGYIVVIARFAVWQIVLTLGLVLAFTLWATVRAVLLLKDLSRPVPSETVLQELERHYAAMKKWMSIQLQVGLLVYPASAAGGFMVGGSLGSGASIDKLFHKPAALIALLAVLAILVPLCHVLVRWMCKKAFSVHVERLRFIIEQLRSTK